MTLRNPTPSSQLNIQYTAEERRFIRYAAQKNIRVSAPIRTGYGRNHIFVWFAEGHALTVRMPRYMWYQNNGIKPFVMTWAEGRTIPMMIGGKVIYRRATRVGEVEDVKNDEGKVIGTHRRWSHPGTRPKRFVQQGIRRTQHQINRTTGKAVVREAVRLVNQGYQRDY